MALSHFVVLSVVLLAVNTEITKFRRCSGVSNDRCSISEVRVTPCTKPERCVIRKGVPATLSYDFTPQFSTDNLRLQLSTDQGSLPEKSACSDTSCPTIAGASQTLTLTLPIGKSYPTGLYSITVKTWNADNPTEDVCCFVTNIQIKKR